MKKAERSGVQSKAGKEVGNQNIIEHGFCSKILDDTMLNTIINELFPYHNAIFTYEKSGIVFIKKVFLSTVAGNFLPGELWVSPSPKIPHVGQRGSQRWMKVRAADFKTCEPA